MAARNVDVPAASRFAYEEIIGMVKEAGAKTADF